MGDSPVEESAVLPDSSGRYEPGGGGADVGEFFSPPRRSARVEAKPAPPQDDRTATRVAPERSTSGSDPDGTDQWKTERFIQTLLREWACIAVYRNSAHRGRALDLWIDYYNNRGPPTTTLGHEMPDAQSADQHPWEVSRTFTHRPISIF